MNTAEFLTIAAAIVPDRTALVCQGRRLAYQEVQERVNRLANALRSLGVGRGDKVAAMGLNSPAYIETYYACAKLGAAFVPLNYRAKREELVYMLNTAEVSLLFLDERYLPLAAEIRPQLTTVRRYVCYDGHPEVGVGPSAYPYEDLLAAASPEEVYVDVDDADPTILMYTSGTTAMPKGTILTYLNLSTYVLNTVEPAMPEIHDVTLLSVPIYHIAGATAIMSSTFAGRTLVVLPQFEPEAWLQAVQEERVTHAFLVPTMLKRILDHPDFARYDLGSLKLLAYGAAPMPYEVLLRAIEAFRCDLMNAYGQTESTSTLTFLGPEDHRIPEGLPAEERERRLRRLRSVGRAMSDVETAIMDPQGRLLPPGAEGEIVARGPRVMAGYFRREEESAQALADGWLHTGDVGYVDEDGYVYITGRTKDLIIRGGENIAPGEVEAVLEEHPSVAEAAVIGVHSQEWGEEVKSIIVLKEGQSATPEELIQHCKGRLASFKAPRYVAFVPELPKNPLGKVLKTELRRLYGEAP